MLAACSAPCSRHVLHAPRVKVLRKICAARFSSSSFLYWAPALFRSLPSPAMPSQLEEMQSETVGSRVAPDASERERRFGFTDRDRARPLAGGAGLNAPAGSKQRGLP
ncbi:hypothetical protein GQ53DRAFT_742594 [Thozetella sp. PMI_491]|nr:hypothetical protein GQ53DRAFT_742594 [Thozetella sp. PMI_491]